MTSKQEDGERGKARNDRMTVGGGTGEEDREWNLRGVGWEKWLIKLGREVVS
jgi:hypothetical protein